MTSKLENVHDYARVLLAGIRIVNGTAALFAPALLARRFGDNPNSAVIYALRMFGIRTIVMGIELLVPDEKWRERSLRYAIPIHASDTASAALAGIQGQLPSRVSILLTALSGFNTILAILAQPRKSER
ncbi:hypothetical protein KSF_067340 [Reticulibacter mediterranei]|uniref:Uncharacterized protein n=1 Tax=Reticulibacter mediterranei TaxID=2778369 RepID=A0A8J3ILF9_9CHLR|nr:hypothetical protein [Reticulibacter mediterranei]GHO96686.1 hypothetical protein KSF_067340 [Reticulibacter mediterranei]